MIPDPFPSPAVGYSTFEQLILEYAFPVRIAGVCGDGI